MKASEETDEETENPGENGAEGKPPNVKTVTFVGIDGRMPKNPPPATGASLSSEPKKKKKKSKSGSGNGGNVNNPNSNPNAGPNSGYPPPRTELPDQGNPNSSNPNMFSYPPQPIAPSYAPYPAYIVSYNTAHPSTSAGPMWYMPPSPYMYASSYAVQSEVYPESYGVPSASSSLNSFEIMSDENPNACSVM